MQVSKYTFKGISSSRESQGWVAIELLLREQVKLSLKSFERYDLEQYLCKLKLQKNPINYRSAIALALAGKYTDSPLNLAQQLYTSLKKQLDPNLIQVQVTPPAWIDFKLTATAVEQWLEENLKQISPDSFPLFISPPNSFAEYIQRRCSSILHLGISENLISENPKLCKIPSFSNQNLLTKADWQFLAQLIATVDELERVSSGQSNEKLALSLAHAFDQFHRHCPIFDRKQSGYPLISQLRLSLIALTQAILRDPRIV
ncbi:hypothetical protein FRE64_04710 [Euhalothece natronophila Z-M001]|uniref:DALR anticodon binding domain-containing protein n=1 Tax=Euhalothece natronophila Z-M001 TaxID=522448 RepID=A0A5B8NJ48_9CHRO|nr:hypothetical protein [Euhalothece natronophila]QDZ39293.1 hypothetical protein FRE64_04710 [Euhalothece natronophila Z-M001]